MSANLIQAVLIHHYAARHGLTDECAARVWIPRRARKFRAWFIRHA
jgi:hypothetical protein